MKLRAFLASLPAALFAGKALAKPQQLKPPVKTWSHRHEQGFVGLIVQEFNHETNEWGPLWKVEREFDQFKDNPYQGVEIICWQNKFWGKRLSDGTTALLCLDQWGTGIRCFHDTPNTDWSMADPYDKTTS